MIDNNMENLSLIGYVHPKALDRLKTGETVAFRKKPYKADGGYPVYADISSITNGKESDGWVSSGEAKPESEQLIVVMREDGRPYSGVYSMSNDYCIDRVTGKWVRGFLYWRPLRLPESMMENKVHS